MPATTPLVVIAVLVVLALSVLPAVAAITVLVSFASTSVSLASTLPVEGGAPVTAVTVSPTAVGASFVPLTVITSLAHPLPAGLSVFLTW